MGAQAIPVRTELVEGQDLGSGTRMSSIPGQTELVEVPNPVVVDARFDRLSANGILGGERWGGIAANGLNVNPVRTELVEGLEPVLVGVRFDRLSESGAGRNLRFDRLSANGVPKIPRNERKAVG